jgi:aspartyl-tRNA(Asn)/glutamyl-tRNA(Gln) amidotransferase subunit B
VEQLRASLPEPPREHRRRLREAWGLREVEMQAVVNAGAVALIEETVAAGASPDGARKWWLGELARRANEQGVDLSALGVSAADVAQLQGLVEAGTLNDKLARTVLEGVIAGEGTPEQVVAARGLAVVSDTGALTRAVDEAIDANPEVAARIRDGRVEAAGVLIGAVMKATKGQADAKTVRALILSRLS